METINNTIYFETDEEFEDFCFAPVATIEKSGDSLYRTPHYSELYKQSLAEGKTFVIMDEDSVIFKRKCATRQLPLSKDGKPTGRDVACQLPIENLEMWFNFLPGEIKDAISKLYANNPDITYSQVAESLDIDEESAFMFLTLWKRKEIY